MNKITVIDSFDGLAAIAEDWDRLQAREARFFPDFLELRARLQDSRLPFRVFRVETNGAVSSLACFVSRDGRQRFSIGERRLFSLPVRWCELVGANVLGQCDAALLRELLGVLDRDFCFDMVTLGEIVLASDLHVAAGRLGDEYRLGSPGRKDAIRWLAKLPDSFEEYLKSLSSNSRQVLRRKIRKFEADLSPTLVTVTQPDQVEQFLRDGESISRKTYQWDIGQKLVDDDVTRRAYKANAGLGRLRAYMIYVDGKPISFLRGRIVGGIFNYDTPGYLPKFSQYSPGTVLLAWAFKDLMENTSCRIFDFGTGGDEAGYKSKFGNISLPSRVVYIARRSRPYPALLVGLEWSLTRVKNLADKLLGDGTLRRRIKKAIRKYER